MASANRHLPADRKMGYMRRMSVAVILLLEPRLVLAGANARGADSCDELHVIRPRRTAPKTATLLAFQEMTPAALPSKPVRCRGFLQSQCTFLSRLSLRCAIY